MKLEDMTIEELKAWRESFAIVTYHAKARLLAIEMEEEYRLRCGVKSNKATK